MSETYDRLITEISESTAVVFGNRPFTSIEPEQVTPSTTFLSGSERGMYLVDDGLSDDVFITEQYVLQQRSGEPVLERHYLRLVFGSITAEAVQLDLDEGTMNGMYRDSEREVSDGFADFMIAQIARIMAKECSDIVIEADEWQPIDQALADSAEFEQLVDEQTLKQRMQIVRDETIRTHAHIDILARWPLRNGTRGEVHIDRSITRYSKLYDLSEAEVRAIINEKTQEFEATGDYWTGSVYRRQRV